MIGLDFGSSYVVEETSLDQIKEDLDTIFQD